MVRNPARTDGSAGRQHDPLPIAPWPATPKAPALNDPLDLRTDSDPGRTDSPDSGVAWAMVEASPDALVVVDSDGLITLVNSQTETMFGYQRDELLGQPVEILVPEALRGVHASHRKEYVEAPSVRTMGSGLELFARRSDGSEFPVEISLSPFQSGHHNQVIAAVRDSTDRTAAQARERSIAKRFRSAFDDGPVPVSICLISPSSDRVILEANQAMADLLGVSIDDLVGRPVIDFCHPDDAEADDAATSAQYVGDVETFSHRKRYVRGDGSIVWVQLTVAVLEREDDAVTTIAHSVDLTAEIEAEQQREARNSALEETRRAQQRAALLEDRERIGRDMHDKVIGRLFATGMRLQSMTTSAVDPATVERLGTAVDEIDEGIREIRSTIYGIRSKVDWGRGARGEVLALAADHAQMLGFEPRVELLGDIDRLPSTVVVEVLSTLRESLVNAAKHASASDVQILLSVRDGEVFVTVTDDGVGFDAEVPSSSHGAGETDYVGQGLRNLSARAEALGGRCSVTSTPGAGTKIQWRVPALGV